MSLILSINYSATVDIVALIFIVLFAIWGAMKGFAKTFFSVFSTILSLLISILLATMVVGFLEEKFSLVTTVSGGLKGVLSSVLGEDVMNAPLHNASGELLKGAGVAGFIIDVILSLKKDSGVPMDTALGDIICPTVGYYCVLIFSIIILFILLKLILFMISELVIKAYKHKIVERTDKLLGFGLGVVNGIINLEFVIMVISIIPIPFLQEVYVWIQGSVLASFLEKINLYGLIMSSFSSINVSGFIKSLL